MHDLYLRFVDRAEAEAVLGSIGIVSVDGIWPCDGPDFVLDVVMGTGIVQKPTGETAVSDGPDGSYEYQVAAAVPGYHVNLLLGASSPLVLYPYLRHPVTPQCRFAP
jgi:hypothetical protein